MIFTISFSLVSAYLLFVVVIYFNQRNLLYLPNENKYLDDQIKFNFEEVFIEVEDKIKLKSWFIKKDLKKFKTLIFFHGNAGNLSNRVYKLNKLSELDLNILIISWRGFNGNSGEPTETNLYKDSNKSIDWLNKQGVESQNIILYGESLGTGVAVELAQKNIFSGVILESPYTSMENAAKIYYPYLPVKILLKDKFDSIKKIKNIKLPILIMHGKKDTIVPFSMGFELFNKANKPKYYFFPDYDDHMMSFNDQLMKNITLFINNN